MRNLVTAALLSCLLVSVVLAHADNAAAISTPLKLSVSPVTKQFVSVYFAYAQATEDHGVQGVKEFTTSDFVFRSPGASSRGKKAYDELSTCIDCFSSARLTAAVRPLTITGTKAVVLTRETFSDKINSTSVAATYYWKQTWRMTPQSWKLASIETQPAEDYDKVQGLTFITETSAKHNTVKLHEQQSMVK